MARDRTAELIRQAAFESLVDFSKARPFDRAWWRWLHDRLDRLERRNLLRVRELQHLQNVGALAAVAPKAVPELWNRANELVDELVREIFPWTRTAADDQAAERKRAAKDLRDLWVETWGDPKDPAVQEKIKNTVLALQGR